MNDRQAELLIETLRESNQILERKMDVLERALEKIHDELREINN